MSSPEGHVTVNETNCGSFINQIETSFDFGVQNEFGAQLPKNLCQEVLEFNRRRDTKRQERIKRLGIVSIEVYTI